MKESFEISPGATKIFVNVVRTAMLDYLFVKARLFFASLRFIRRNTCVFLRCFCALFLQLAVWQLENTYNLLRRVVNYHGRKRTLIKTEKNATFDISCSVLILPSE